MEEARNTVAARVAARGEIGLIITPAMVRQEMARAAVEYMHGKVREFSGIDGGVHAGIEGERLSVWFAKAAQEAIATRSPRAMPEARALCGWITPCWIRRGTPNPTALGRPDSADARQLSRHVCVGYNHPRQAYTLRPDSDRQSYTTCLACLRALYIDRLRSGVQGKRSASMSRGWRGRVNTAECSGTNSPCFTCCRSLSDRDRPRESGTTRIRRISSFDERASVLSRRSHSIPMAPGFIASLISVRFLVTHRDSDRS